MVVDAIAILDSMKNHVKIVTVKTGLGMYERFN